MPMQLCAMNYRQSDFVRDTGRQVTTSSWAISITQVYRTCQASIHSDYLRDGRMVRPPRSSRTILALRHAYLYIPFTLRRENATDAERIGGPLKGLSRNENGPKPPKDHARSSQLVPARPSEPSPRSIACVVWTRPILPRLPTKESSGSV